EPLAAVPGCVGGRRRLLVLERHAKPLAQPLGGLREVKVLGLANERDEVAALAAAEAVEELVDGVDGKARRPLLVKRAAARVASSDAGERRPALDDLHPV